MPTLTLISAEDPFERVVEQAEAAVRAGFIADYLAASRIGDVIMLDRLAYEIELYDAANPEQSPLMDEIAGLSTPAAA
jgi:hypothetical protein